jgi:uncharacterized protein (TIGR00299 family) protein
MLLCALDDLGAQPLAIVDQLAAAVGPVKVRTVETTRGGLRARALDAELPTGHPLRTLPDLLAVVDALALPAQVATTAGNVLRRLARAESHVHGVDEGSVHFHEVGAVDTVLDVAAVCAGFAKLGVDSIVVSPVALGGGAVDTSHGRLPVPGPAVLQLLADSCLTGVGGPVEVELATPTGVALLAELADRCGSMQPMSVTAIGCGAGSREIAGLPNVVRIVVGDMAAADDGEPWLLVEANVDDLDPRLWPGVIDALLGAGAADAWLTPILMKKGRAAHTIAALVPPAAVDKVANTMFTETSTIGVRTTAVGKRALQRSWIEVDVEGQRVRVKLARLDGSVVNVSPEFDDVAAAAKALDRPVKAVLAEAAAIATRQL